MQGITASVAAEALCEYDPGLPCIYGDLAVNYGIGGGPMPPD